MLSQVLRVGLLLPHMRKQHIVHMYKYYCAATMKKNAALNLTANVRGHAHCRYTKVPSNAIAVNKYTEASHITLTEKS